MRSLTGIRPLATTLAAALFAACGGDGSNNEPARQIDLAPSKVAEPQLADAPVPEAAPAATPVRSEAKRTPPPPREEPRASEPPVQAATAATAAVAVAAEAEPPPPPAPTTGSIAAGTAFTVKPATKICTNTHKAGDRFTATLASAMQGTNGAEVPAGALAIVRVVEGPADAKTGKRAMAFDILSVRVGDQTYEVVAHVTQSTPLQETSSQSTADKAKKVGAGAAIGAIAGRVLGGNTKSTVLGGAIGAAAGAAVAAGDTRTEGCLGEDGSITLALDKPLVLRIAP